MKKDEEFEMLKEENILLGQKAESKENIIRLCGNLLHKSGYVAEEYIESMIARDAGFSVAIGNLIAIPHAEKEAACHIKKTGMCVLTFPEGFDWDGNQVKLVIGIAALGNEHLEILSNIVETLEEESDVETLIEANSKEKIIETFTGKKA